MKCIPGGVEQTTVQSKCLACACVHSRSEVKKWLAFSMKGLEVDFVHMKNSDSVSKMDEDKKYKYLSRKSPEMNYVMCSNYFDTTLQYKGQGLSGP